MRTRVSGRGFRQWSMLWSMLFAAAWLIPACVHAQAPAGASPATSAIQIPPAVQRGGPAQASPPAAAVDPAVKPPAAGQASAASGPTQAPAAQAPTAAAPATGQPVSQTSGVPGTQNPAAGGPSQDPAMANAGEQTVAGPPTDTGLCQCIGNFKDLDFRCPSSMDSCQSQCGTRFSFVPTAQCTKLVR